MPAFVKSRFGESGRSDDDGTMVCCFSRKKSKKDWRISAEVMRRESQGSGADFQMESQRGKSLRFDERFPASTLFSCAPKLFLKSSVSFRKSTSPAMSTTSGPPRPPGIFLPMIPRSSSISIARNRSVPRRSRRISGSGFDSFGVHHPAQRPRLSVQQTGGIRQETARTSADRPRVRGDRFHLRA